MHKLGRLALMVAISKEHESPGHGATHRLMGGLTFLGLGISSP